MHSLLVPVYSAGATLSHACSAGATNDIFFQRLQVVSAGDTRRHGVAVYRRWTRHASVIARRVVLLLRTAMVSVAGVASLCNDLHSEDGSTKDSEGGDIQSGRIGVASWICWADLGCWLAWGGWVVSRSSACDGLLSSCSVVLFNLVTSACMVFV
jgi:hypothetical protein